MTDNPDIVTFNIPCGVCRKTLSKSEIQRNLREQTVIPPAIIACYCDEHLTEIETAEAEEIYKKVGL